MNRHTHQAAVRGLIRQPMTDDYLAELVRSEYRPWQQPASPDEIPRRVAALQRMGPAERRLKAAFCLLAGAPLSFDLLHRDLVVGTYPGAYGTAGVVIVLQGTPPRGTLNLQASSEAITGPEHIEIARVTFDPGRGRPLRLRTKPQEAHRSVVHAAIAFLIDAGHFDDGGLLAPIA